MHLKANVQAARKALVASLMTSRSDARPKSLQVFFTGIVLSFGAHAAIEFCRGSIWVQIFVDTIGILPLTAGARYWTGAGQRDLLLPRGALAASRL